ISVARLCEEFHVSRTYLYTQLEEHTKEGVAGYIREQRLSKAEAMLKITTVPITQVSSAVGFTDYNYFLRVFKKRFGISPKNLRRDEARKARGAK
ncbi:MAG: helix-turn-helix transcriptional regulator, partial [Clostridia bacterium]|nr:helix-turn-helix transcriptional regulator [Clostridia bacterium]